MEFYSFLNNRNNWLSATLLLGILALVIVLGIFRRMNFWLSMWNIQ